MSFRRSYQPLAESAAAWPFFGSHVTNLSIQVEFLQAIYPDHLVWKDLW
jgi:hypothetical protein